MSRLIEAEPLRKRVCSWFHQDPQEAGPADDAFVSLIYAIDEAPTVDAVPVRRGTRIDSGEMEKQCCKSYICSWCGERMCGELNYCPNCGAKMEGGE